MPAWFGDPLLHRLRLRLRCIRRGYNDAYAQHNLKPALNPVPQLLLVTWTMVCRPICSELQNYTPRRWSADQIGVSCRVLLNACYRCFPATLCLSEDEITWKEFWFVHSASCAYYHLDNRGSCHKQRRVLDKEFLVLVLGQV
jgi:hypothetical protein